MKNKLLNEGRLLEDDIKLIRQKIIFRKPYGEVINFLVSRLGLTRIEADSVYDDLVIECHGSWKGVKTENKP